MNVLDLFSGIGGFSLGLERAGMRTVAFCEIDPFCRKVLAKHWPSVPIHHDIAKLKGTDVGAVDVICGGFPCQDISTAGRMVGMEGRRSGLWGEYARIISEVRPRFVIVENVSALLARGLDVVLRDLAALGFDAEWHCIPASAVGAPHRRDRVWIVAHTPDAIRRTVAGGVGESQSREGGETPGGRLRKGKRPAGDAGPSTSGSYVADPDSMRQLQPQGIVRDLWGWPGDGSWWDTEPAVDRMANGIPNGVDRTAALGNAVVPQIPEIIGRAIMKVAT
jgi:DNA (cytosine-5)-methyltransferase 1